MVTENCEHDKDGFCSACCDKCNWDMHQCPKCGMPIAHSLELCEDCNNDEVQNTLTNPHPPYDHKSSLCENCGY